MGNDASEKLKELNRIRDGLLKLFLNLEKLLNNLKKNQEAKIQIFENDQSDPVKTDLAAYDLAIHLIEQKIPLVKQDLDKTNKQILQFFLQKHTLLLLSKTQLKTVTPKEEVRKQRNYFSCVIS